MHGEENLLWNTPVNWFAKAAELPTIKQVHTVTEESLYDCHLPVPRCFNNVLTDPDGDLLTGKGLVVEETIQININEDIHYGGLSAVLPAKCP